MQRSGLPVRAIFAICVPVGLVVVAILAAIAIPVFLNQRSAPVVPDSLGGLARSTGPGTETVERARQQLSKQIPGGEVGMALYGTTSTGYLLMAVHPPVDQAREFAEFGLTGAPTSFGDVQCASNPARHASACLRSGARGSVEVLQFRADSDLAQLAAVTGAAWSAQPFGN